MRAARAGIATLARRHFCAAVFVWVLAIASASAPAATRPDFTGLWQMADADLVVKPDDDESNLTEETLRRRAYYRANYDAKLFDPSKSCVPHGLPWIMTSRARNYVIDIFQAPSRITMLFEGMDVHRLIRFGPHLVPDEFLPSTNGWSTARWEDRTLVIETSALAPRHPIGLMQRSDEARVTERWRLVQHPKFGEAIDVEITVVDPVVYRAPAHGRQLFVRAPAGTVLNYYGCNETAWEERLARVERERAAQDSGSATTAPAH